MTISILWCKSFKVKIYLAETRSVDGWQKRFYIIPMVWCSKRLLFWVSCKDHNEGGNNTIASIHLIGNHFLLLVKSIVLYQAAVQRFFGLGVQTYKEGLVYWFNNITVSTPADPRSAHKFIIIINYHEWEMIESLSLSAMVIQRDRFHRWNCTDVKD